MTTSTTQNGKMNIHGLDSQWRIQDFPRGGGRQPPGGAPGYDFIKFSQKLHEIEKKLVARGGGGAPPRG